MITLVFMRQTAKKVVFSESWSEVCATEMWCERWSIKINENTTQAIYFSHRLRFPEAHRTLNERNIPFVNHAKYLGVIETAHRND
jgi:hypothetical protein